MTQQQRGKNRSLVGAALQVLFTVVMALVWLYSGSEAAFTAVWFLLGGVLLWLLAALIFYVRRQARREELELQEIAATDPTQAGLFEGEDAQDVRPAAARAELTDKWVVPSVTLLLAAYQAALGVLLLRGVATAPVAEIEDPSQWALLIMPIAFAAFLFSRYAIGLAAVSDLRLFRPTGSYLFASVLLAFGVAAVLLGAHQDYTVLDGIVAWVAPLLMVVLAFEMVVNLILDVYRPRVPGQEHRPAFDSRLLNLVAEPSRVGHTVAETLNYQFGFEVSGTWFYKLLSRSFVPMVTLAMLALFAVSSLLIVREGETAIVKQWGQIDFSRKPLTAGVHLKWPWPMGTVDRFETGRRHDLLLGVGQKQEPLIVNGRELYLWTREHGRRKERNFVIALPSEDGPDGPSKAEQSVNVIKLVAQVYYRITDEYKYGYTVTDPDKTLHDLAYGEMTRYCAGATLTEILDSDPDRPEALMTTGRAPAARRLKERIQRAADEYAGSGLGVKVTHVGFLTVHPPAEAAQAYQEVLDAQLRVQQTRYEAMADAHQTLSRVAGDPVTALKLALAVQQVENELSSLADRQDQPLQMRVKMDNALARAREQVEHWSEQVDRDRQLGHGQQELQTANQVMLREHREHLQELEEIDQALREEKLDSLTPSIEQRLARARARLEGEAASGGLLAQATGEAAQVIAEAKAKRWARTLSEEARALAFRRQKRAYESSPQHYMQDKYLAVLEDVLPDIKKYVMGFPRSAAEVRLNLEEEASGMENIDFQNVEGSGR